MAASYQWQKLGEAVSALALGTDTIQDRLQDTYTFLSTLRIHGMENPEHQAKLDEICDRLSARKTDSPLGAVAMTVREMSDDDARDLAREIVDLNSSVWYQSVWDLEDKLKERVG